MGKQCCHIFSVIVDQILFIFVFRFCLFCAFTRPKYQVSVYRTIGPLVCVFKVLQCIYLAFQIVPWRKVEVHKHNYYQVITCSYVLESGKLTLNITLVIIIIIKSLFLEDYILITNMKLSNIWSSVKLNKK